MHYRKRKKNSLLMLLILLVSLGIGYALISTDLTINGVGKFNNQAWNVYFDNLTPNSENVALSTGDVAATIDQTTHTDISFTVTLQEPGDFYEFTVDVINDGTMDAMVGLVTNMLNGNPISSTNPVPAYARYTATYDEETVAIASNHLLEHGLFDTYKVRLEYRTDINPEDLPDTPQTLTFNFGVQYVQADSNAIERPTNKSNINLFATASEVTYGEHVVIVVDTDVDYTGNVKVFLNQITYNVSISAGKGYLVSPILNAGEYTAKIIALGDSNYKRKRINIPIIVNTYELEEEDIKFIDQENGTIIIVVPDDVEGEVTISFNGHSFNAPVVDGVAEFVIDSSLYDGLSYNVTIDFVSANSNYSSITVSREEDVVTLPSA